MRRLDNWLKSYMEWTEDTESAKIFHRWVGLVCISSAVRKKVWIRSGRLNYHSNIYVVLVSEPGRARKSQAISYGRKLIDNVKDIAVAADVTSVQAMYEDLELEASREALMNDGSKFLHNSLTIWASEFEAFLGHKSENTKMLTALTDFFDCSDRPFRYRAKTSTSSTVPSVWLTILGATTPESLANSLPSVSIGGGLTSRIMFIFAHDKEKRIAIPQWDANLSKLQEDLVHDLAEIAMLAGPAHMSPEGEKWWIKWYEQYDEASPKRLCLDRSFDAWYSRKPMYIQKIALLLCVSEGDKLLVEPYHYEEALEFVEHAEKHFEYAFTAVGRSDMSGDINDLITIIRKRKNISEKELLKIVWRNMNIEKFRVCIQTAERMGAVKSVLSGGETIYCTMK